MVLYSRPETVVSFSSATGGGAALTGGGLRAKPGGEHPFPAVQTWGFTQHNQFFALYDTPQRSVYQMQQRLRKHPFFALFDGADTNSSTAVRPSSWEASLGTTSNSQPPP